MADNLRMVGIAAQYPDTAVRAKVATLTAYHVRIPLKKTIRHASHTRRDSENIVVECRLDDGSTGFGEGVPRDYVTGETAGSCLSLLRATDWTRLPQPRDFLDLVEGMRQFELPAIPGDERGCLGNAARCALETAVLDAFGRRFGFPLWKLATLRPEWSDIASLRKRCRYSGAITSKRNLFREVLSACKVKLGWFSDCKIKVATAGQDDPRRLSLFRTILGQKVDFRIDANEGWRADEVADKLAELAPYRISAVEQPVPHEQVEQLANVRKEISVPIMLDESLCSSVDARRAIDGGWCDLFNIRLSKCGGLLRSLDLAAMAHRAGLGYQLGCQVGETGILSAAGRHFACSVAHLRYLEGSYDHHLVRERLTKENLTFEFAGIADAIDKPGLGITVEPHRLERVTIARLPLLS